MESSAISTKDQQQALLQLLKEMSIVFWGPDQEKCVALLKESFFNPFEKINALPGFQMSKTLTEIKSVLKKFTSADALYLHLEEAYVRLFLNDIKGVTAPLYASCYANKKSDEKGRFEAANGGDIFLDEIGDVPLSIQVKLLRVLEAKQFERVGDHQPVSVDVRIITATNKNLEELIAQKQFREDFFFRVDVFPIFLPPLWNRIEDIPLLVHTFIRRLQSVTTKKITGLTPAAMERFMDYDWPGNIRELKSALEFAFVIAEDGLINLDQLPPNIARTERTPNQLNQQKVLTT